MNDEEAKAIMDYILNDDELRERAIRVGAFLETIKPLYDTKQGNDPRGSKHE